MYKIRYKMHSICSVLNQTIKRLHYFVGAINFSGQFLGLNFLVKFLASNIRILKECEFCNIAFSFSVTPIVLYKLRTLSECRFYNTAYDDNSLIVESGQSSEALHQHGLPKLREWSGGGHCQCFFAPL